MPLKCSDVMPDPIAETPARLDWLDALRGIAVLAVVYEHLRWRLLPDVHRMTDPWIHAGEFGVMLFFLVSGYIVPASLERHGSLAAFWISRVFRLYPAFLLTSLLAVGAAAVGIGWIPETLDEERVAIAVSHLTMLQEFIGAGNLQHQFWTLSYEMAFYVLVSVLFVAALHRFSAAIATALACLAVLGADLPARMFSDGRSRLLLAVAVGATLILCVPALSMRSRRVRLLAAVMLVVMLGCLLCLNQRAGGWEGILILAVMFTGTSIKRAVQGQTPRWHAFGAAGAVLTAGLVNIWLSDTFLVAQDSSHLSRSWFLALLLAGALFVGAMLARRRAVPTWLSWIGRISYSIYLLHFLVIYVMHESLWAYRGAAMGPRLAVAVTYIAALLALSHLMYRVVELPFQRFGRSIIARLTRQPMVPATRVPESATR
jgi:peptidoglycan/LPS O-acetylase OafA/YrhL